MNEATRSENRRDPPRVRLSLKGQAGKALVILDPM
jgi:hypothetical protein